MYFTLRRKLRSRLILLLVLAVGVLGFGHRPTVGPLDPALLAFLAAGGSLADICRDFEPGEINLGEDCESCRLLSSVCLPTPAELPAPGSRFVLAVLTSLTVEAPGERPFDHSRPTRAPPAA